MFTGIVEEVGRVSSATAGSLTIAAGVVLQGIGLGDSINVNGVCLTVTSFDDSVFTVGLMAETLNKTNLGRLAIGARVNLERAMILGGRLGGHLVQGHIDTTGNVVAIRRDGEAMVIGFETAPDIMYYIVEKGFIAVDGISLTVTTRDDTSFQVSVVDFTRRQTTLGDRRAGDQVNLEVDIIAKYVEQSQTRRGGITVDFLAEHGFLVS